MVFTEKEEEWKDGETTNPTTDVQNVVNEGRFTAVKVKKVLMVIILNMKVMVIQFLKQFR